MKRYVVWLVLFGIFIIVTSLSVVLSSQLQSCIFVAIMFGAFLTLTLSKRENFSNLGLTLFCFSTIIVTIFGIVCGNVITNIQ